jgi:hexosaminidase
MQKTISRLIILIIIGVTLNSCDRDRTEKMHIIPRPDGYFTLKDYFRIKEKTRILYDFSVEGMDKVANYLRDKIKTASGLELKIEDLVSVRGIKDDIVFAITDIDSAYGTEGYVLEVRERSVYLRARDPRGTFYGVQSLLQLLPPEIESKEKVEDISLKIPCTEIWDKPTYPWRGMHLDVARHFFDKEFVKKFLDYMAMHKMYDKIANEGYLKALHE